MNIDLAQVKLYCEIAAYGFAALFLITRLITGQLNAGMEVGLELVRSADPKNVGQDDLAVTVRLKRTHLGRREIKDVLLEVSDAAVKGSEPKCLSIEGVTAERKTAGGLISRKPENRSRRGIALPPGDATQVAYLLSAGRDESVLMDVTVLAVRTGPWIGKPQWRASAVSLPNRPTS